MVSEKSKVLYHPPKIMLGGVFHFSKLHTTVCTLHAQTSFDKLT